ncbi:MAG: guanylate kinase [Desulfatirhabdiaceae bacterium]
MMNDDPSCKPVAGNPHQSAGRLFIVSAPSGAGKTTLCREVLKRIPDLLYSVSHTTRAPRLGEVDGVDYHFISNDQFLQKISEDRWAEWAEVHGNYYGTSADFIEENLSHGKSILLDIDVQGARQIRQRFSGSIAIFILPPSLTVLKDRLTSRQTDPPSVIEKRLAHANAEISESSSYDHVLVNDGLSDSVEQLTAWIQFYTGRADR